MLHAINSIFVYGLDNYYVLIMRKRKDTNNLDLEINKLLPGPNEPIHSIEEIFFLFSHVYEFPFIANNLCPSRWENKRTSNESFIKQTNFLTTKQRRQTNLLN